MKTLLIYLVQVILASGILYAYYHTALRNQKFHAYNRFYLLATVLISITIPFLQIPVYFSASQIQSSVVLQTWQSISGAPIFIKSGGQYSHFDFSWNYLLYALYAIIVVALLVKLFFSFVRIKRLINANPAEELGGIRFINTNEPDAPFSFFRWLFWNRKLDLSSGQGEQVFRHEVFHIRQRHSLDLIVLELITVVLWINPFFHLIKKELKTIHEFLADRFATTEENKWEYSELLLMQALQTRRQLVNPFFHTQIKRRIAMITNPQKTSHQYMRKLLVLPIAALLICLLAFRYTDRMRNNVIPQLPPKDSHIQQTADNSSPSPANPNLIEKTRSFTPNTLVAADTTPKKGVMVHGYDLESQGGIWIDGKEPLIVIDNVVQPRNAVAYKKIKELNPGTISSINVLKEGSALTKYGTDGKDGVIEIFTKKLSDIRVDSLATLNPLAEEVVVTGHKIGKSDVVRGSAGDVGLDEVVVTGYGVRNDNKIFEKLEIEPSFPGGEKAWYSYLTRNLDASIPLKSHAPAGTYIVYIEFLVMADGSIRDIKPLTNHGFGMEEEAIRVIKKGPGWKPGMQNGKAVNAYKRQAIAFAIIPEDRRITSI